MADIFLDFIRKLKREPAGNHGVILFTAVYLGSPLVYASTIHPSPPLPAWASERIYLLEGTNATVLAPSNIDPEIEALELLDQPTVNETSPPLPAFYRLGTLEHQGGINRNAVPQDEKSELRLAIQYLTDAETLIREGDRISAIAELKTFLEKAKFDQPRFMILGRLGTLLFQQQLYDQAAFYLRQALDIDSQDLSMLSNYSAALLSTGESKEAIKTLKDINVDFLENQTLKFSIYFNLACGYSLENQPEEALKALVQAANTDPAATVTSLVDRQLDNIRDDKRFLDLQKALEQYVLGRDS